MVVHVENFLRSLIRPCPFRSGAASGPAADFGVHMSDGLQKKEKQGRQSNLRSRLRDQGGAITTVSI
jgi:hypothetical protein